jgi:ABC-type lipopolysaccharide export system ATPase subunit
MAQLIAKEIVKRYRKRVVVDAVSLTVASGEVVGLLGPNGAGKTTSFYIMVGLIHCDEGRVLLDDRDLTHLPMHARALAADPAFILLDEPFAGVDPLSVLDIQRIIEHLRERRIGVLITDHNVRETLGICDRAYILNEGQVIAEGDPAAILANQQVRQVYLGESFEL